MKKTYTGLILAFIFTYAIQAQGWQWGKQLSKCADTLLESKLVGLASGTNDVYVGMQQYFIKTSVNRHQVLHFNASGALTWAQSLPNFWELMNMVADQAGDVYFSGRFYGSGQIGPYTLSAANAPDIFLVKINKGGRVQWAKTIDNHASDYNCELSIARNNELMVVLDLHDSLFAGNFSQVRDTARTEHVIARYDPAGNLVYTCKESGSAGFHYWADDIMIIEGDSGKLFWSSNVAYYTQSAEFKILSSAGAKLAGKAINDYYYDMQVDSKGYIYIIQNTGSHYMSVPVLNKYDRHFNKLWSLGLGGTYLPYFFGKIVIDAQDRIFLSGRNGNSYFGSSGANVFGNDTVSYSGPTTGLMAEIDSSGNYLEVTEHPIKGSSFNYEATDNAGSMYLGVAYINTDTSFAMGNDLFDLQAGAQYNYSYCGGTSLLKWNYGTQVSIDKNEDVLFPDLYPNPAREVFYIPVSRPTHYSVFNVCGQQVLTGDISPRSAGVTISDLSNGIYFVKLDEDRGGWRKLIVQ